MNIFFNNGDKEEFEIENEKADEVINLAKTESNTALEIDINNSTHLIKNSINYINFSE